MLPTNLKYQLITWRRQLKEYMALRKHKGVYLKQLKKSVSTIRRLDTGAINNDKNEIRLFAIFRNESLRLPHFIEYYKQLGVNRFFLIDNNSTDNSKEIIAKEENLHIFSTSETYVNHWYWMEYLLDNYGKNHWCVVVDIDELFWFPNAESLNIRALTQYMEEEGSTAIRTFLLDMYPAEQVGSSAYDGGSPLLYLPYFDREYQESYFGFFDRIRFLNFRSVIFTGGMRERVFGVINPPHILSKIPLFKNLTGSYLVQGMHAINGAKVSDIQGAVFHTKFLSDFISEVNEEVKRGEHYGGAFYYKHFEDGIKKNPEISFHYEGSVRYVDSRQLVSLGIMKTSQKYEQFCSDLKEKKTHDDLSDNQQTQQ